MKMNEGKVDRAVRIVLGLAIIGAGVAFGSWWGAVGLIGVGTGVVGYCPLYSVFGFNTCPISQLTGTK